MSCHSPHFHSIVAPRETSLDHSESRTNPGAGRSTSIPWTSSTAPLLLSIKFICYKRTLNPPHVVDATLPSKTVGLTIQPSLKICFPNPQDSRSTCSTRKVLQLKLLPVHICPPWTSNWFSGLPKPSLPYSQYLLPLLRFLSSGLKLL